MRTPVLLVVTAALGAASAAMAPAALALAVDAPPSSASAVAAQVGDLASIGRTAVRTDPSTAKAEAHAVEVQGKPLVEGRTGGSQTGTGRSSGSLADTQEIVNGSPARVEATPWSAETSTTPAKRSAVASAALARVTVAAVPLSVTILGTTSRGEHTGATSTASAESDAVDLVVGGQRVRVLHSDASSSGQVSSYLLGLNGVPVVGNEQVGQLCALVLPPVAALSCLQADGGEGSADARATALLAAFAPDGLPDSLVSDATAGGATASAPGEETPGAPDPGPGSGEPGTAAPGLGAPGDDPGGALPFTGSAAAALAAMGAWLATAGGWLTVAGRRRAAA